MRRARKLAPRALALFLVAAMPVLSYADEYEDLLSPGTESAGGGTSEESGKQSPDLVSAYQSLQQKIGVSFDLYSVAGGYAGWKTAYPSLPDLNVNFDPDPLAGLVLTTTFDLRPADYLRVHAAFSLSAPSSSGVTMAWGDYFLDYAVAGLFSLRAGKYSVGWGNARILSAADLPARNINYTNLSTEIDILPSWISGSSTANWGKVDIPLGPANLTLLGGLPIGSELHLRNLRYGALAETSFGKIALGLSAFNDTITPRAGLTIKTSAFGIDLFSDSSLSFPSTGNPLVVSSAGLYYQTSSGPDIKVTAEMRWNGENIPGQSRVVGDSMEIGGLSQAIALQWNSVGGSALSFGGTWYHSWSDGSGALVPALSLSLMNLVSAKLILPWVYGASGSDYRKNLPSEANGYILGAGLVIVLKNSF